MFSKKHPFNSLYLLASWFLLLCCSCGGSTDKSKENTPVDVNKDFSVKIHIKAAPKNFNLITSSNGITTEIIDVNVQCGLLEIDPDNLTGFRPYLAASRPRTEAVDGDQIAYHYEIRPEATWDNGTPVTAEDYVFTVKAIKNPKTNAASQRPFLECIRDIKIDPTNPKKFTIYCSLYHLAELATGVLPILPAYHYDAQGLMSDFTISELNDPAQLDRLLKDQRIVDFAEDFNNNYNLDKEMIKGAGAYVISEIVDNQHIKLERKKEWWGDQVDLPYIAAYPQSILFRVLADDNNALLALKEQEIDVMPAISEDQFVELQESERVQENFNLTTADGFSYRYIGLNSKSPQLSEVAVRKALAHLVDKEYITNELSNGLATPVNGPVSPLKEHYNTGIVTTKFDVEKAANLLQEAGWADTDGDNILDKSIDGQRVQLSLRMLYPKGKKFYKDVAQIFKDEASRVGIDVQLIATEFSIIIKRLKDRDFDLYILAWGQAPTLDDFKQIWHTESDTYEGSNMVGFGNEESDQIIETIRVTIDEEARRALYMRFQEMIAEEQPYIFLVAPKFCMASHKRFKNASALALLRPGYFARLFQLNENYQGS